MKILVTGGCGQVGSHVVELLLGRGDQVLAIDNLATGRREHLKDHQNLEVLIDTIADKELIDGYAETLTSAVTKLAETEAARKQLSQEVEASRLLTPAEAQAYLKCSHDSLTYYRRFGLEPYKKGKDSWYTKAIIDAWLATGRVNRHKRN